MSRFAYVDVACQEAMKKIISRSEEVLDGRAVLIKNAKNFEGRPAVKKQRYHVKSTILKPSGKESGKSAGNVKGSGAVGNEASSE